jgi:transcription factor S
MIFCDKCGSIMVPKKEKDKKIMICSSCNFIDKNSESKKLKETIPQSKEIDILLPDEEKTLPEIEIECQNCKFNKAVYWLVQTRSGDEAETKFYKCLKCKHTWREYD